MNKLSKITYHPPAVQVYNNPHPELQQWALRTRAQYVIKENQSFQYPIDLVQPVNLQVQKHGAFGIAGHRIKSQLVKSCRFIALSSLLVHKLHNGITIAV